MRFSLERDINFFKSISQELVNDIVTTLVVLYKLSISDSPTNIYGESTSKTYYQGVECPCLIDRGETTANYEGMGSDISQTVSFRFNRFTLESNKFYPEIGDIIFHNNAYFEVDNVLEDQLIAGRPEEKYSIICETFMTKRSNIQIENRNV